MGAGGRIQTCVAITAPLLQSGVFDRSTTPASTYILRYLEPRLRIGLEFEPYQGPVLPLNYPGGVLDVPCITTGQHRIFYLETSPRVTT